MFSFSLSSRIHLAKASEENLQRLTDACEPATFGVNQQDVLDESYRKAGKLNADDFSTNFNLEKSGILDIVRSELLMGHDETKQIEVERYKLNVYGMVNSSVRLFRPLILTAIIMHR